MSIHYGQVYGFVTKLYRIHILVLHLFDAEKIVHQKLFLNVLIWSMKLNFAQWKVGCLVRDEQKILISYGR